MPTPTSTPASAAVSTPAVEPTDAVRSTPTPGLPPSDTPRPAATVTPVPPSTATPTPTAHKAASESDATVSPSPGRDDDHFQDERSAPPSDLFLPFRTKDVGGSSEFISPFGIIRHSRDAGHGHGGIDVPLNANAPIYAVADGAILSAEASSDGVGGSDIKLLIFGSRGEGWGFLYEHVTVRRQNKWDKRGAFEACNLDANRLRQFSDLPTSVRLDSFASPPVSSPVWRLAVRGTYPPA